MIDRQLKGAADQQPFYQRGLLEYASVFGYGVRLPRPITTGPPARRADARGGLSVLLVLISRMAFSLTATDR